MERPGFTRQATEAAYDEKSNAITPGVRSTSSTGSGNNDAFEMKGLGGANGFGSVAPAYRDAELMQDEDLKGHLDTAEDIVTTVIHVEDDPTLSPWTFRMFFIGIGLSAFGAVLQEIFYFKPQVIFVSVMFLTIIAAAIGESMARVIPRWGPVGRFLNPGPWNMKEHAAAVIMASAASVSALSTEALAAQKLFYGGYPNQGAAFFVTLSSQLIGYGFAGMMRGTLLFPTKMLYPANLPVTTVLETLHKDKAGSKKRMKVFWIVFSCLMVWELLPEYIFPLLIGVSVFCLAHQDSLVFTNLFGGAQGNEGVGLLSLSFDWNYIAGFGSPLWLPLQTQINSLIGTIGCMVMFMAIYYGNIWRSLDFPFLSQQLYDNSSNFTSYNVYNLSAILNPDLTINDDLVDQQGIPWLTGTYTLSLITNNAGFTANFVHMFLWNYHEIKSGWAMFSLKNLKLLITPSTYMFWTHKGKRTQTEKEEILSNPDLDPHFKLMVENDYEEAPDYWYFFAFASSFIVALVCLYVMKSTLPWWGLVFGMVLMWIYMLFFGAQYAITGFGFNLSTVSQTIAGYLFPGKPLANMYFTSYTYGGYGQGIYLLRDLKLAQQTKLSPKCTFTTQMIGCLFGAALNYLMMISIVQNQTAALLSIEGTPIWSGVNIQSFNTAAISWSIAPKMFSIGARYHWVGASYFLGFIVPVPFYIAYRLTKRSIFSYLNLSIILWYFGYLVVGINSSITSYFIIGIFGQYYLRKYRPLYFVKWNYLVSAALDGGTQVMIFLLSFAVAGASGTSRPFPAWAGNHLNNVDYCAYNPANG